MNTVANGREVRRSRVGGAAVFEALAQRWSAGTATALVQGPRRITYDELQRSVATVAARLRSAGAGTGTPVLLVMENSIELVVAILAIMLLDGVEICVSPAEAPMAFDSICDKARPRIVLASARGHALAASLADAGFERWLLSDGVTGWCHPQHQPPAALDAAVNAGVFSIQFTSGSTGEPKGVALTGAGVLETVFRAPHLSEHEGQRLFLGIPICNSYGKTQLVELLWAGATVILADGMGDPFLIGASLAATGATVVEGPPAVFELLVRSQAFHRESLAAIQRIGMAGGKIRRALLDALWSTLPNARITNRYGVTEIAGPICRTTLAPTDINAGLVPCGRPVPFVDVRLYDGGQLVTLIGVPGEVVVRSPGLMWGYFPCAVESHDYATGDIAFFGESGQLYLIDRSSAMIKRDGVRIFPREIELAVARDPRVAECVVVALENPRTLREQIVAVVVLTDGQDPRTAVASIRETCAVSLPREKRPDRIELRAAIPIGPTGKYDTRQLRRSLDA